MAKTKMTTQADKPDSVVQRNIALLEKLMQYLLAEPQLFKSLPDNFELVILPDDDPDIRLYNLALLDRYGSQGRPVVFVRMKSRGITDFTEARPSLYVPLAA